MSETGRHEHRGRSSEDNVEKALALNALGIRPGQTILDAGCGNGYMSKAFASALGDTGKVVALDPDEAAIAILQGETAGTTIEAVVGDISQTTGLPQASVDLIYLSNVFHGFTPGELTGFLAEVDRLLRPDGTLAVVEFVKKNADRPAPRDTTLSGGAASEDSTDSREHRQGRRVSLPAGVRQQPRPGVTHDVRKGSHPCGFAPRSRPSR